MADSLLVAVAGGAVGSVLTILARYGAVPAEVRQHDQETTDMDRDLNRFAADESARLMGVIFEIRFPNHEPPNVEKAVIAYECGKAVAWSIQLYRDEETARIRQYRDLVGSEKWAHLLWRKLGHRPVVELETPDKASALLDVWPKLVPGAHPINDVRDFDPRGRNIDDMLSLLTEYLSDPRATQ